MQTAANKIYVGNISFETREDDLQQHFEQFGTVSQIRIPTDMNSGRSRGFAFITFDSSQAAQSATSLHGQTFAGRKLRVNIAEDKEKVSRRG
jgi:cold-inducible RNA-binding protein